jgi:tetratricopeptide (TPR) repeat protein
MAVDKYPKEWDSWSTLADVFKINGDYDRVIEVLHLGIHETSSEELLRQLADTYLTNNEALNVIRTLIENGSLSTVHYLVKAYKGKCDQDGLIKDLENLMEKMPQEVSRYLAEALVENEDYEGAIKVLKTASKRPNLS